MCDDNDGGLDSAAKTQQCRTVFGNKLRLVPHSELFKSLPAKPSFDWSNSKHMRQSRFIYSAFISGLGIKTLIRSTKGAHFDLATVGLGLVRIGSGARRTKPSEKK